ncbi:hypothetical protein EV644_12455 [Kribbella orskensis]|uniref:Uncharacterized protein n=1 Tax=Kribbella orskensis TaxID=2512216 RepID=A0ABY2B9R4_9ACTN|nr:hypothetical protein EV642_12643 [Kribbella sp. VKM Ac-2500]TCO12931.1 hypothetical protein EV644_12455 [Kribbella orskensis]
MRRKPALNAGPLLAVVMVGADKSAPTLKALETWLVTNLNTITIVC